ncbi:MAG: Uracil-DNA glycosylase-like protein [uncultured bacterium (gcode 4)]|uniref:Uracil-DNA glycosylase-like protein n=1 Tax=uncultured bacterium (gcode 4) TaxID=1234023 RepID=K2H3A8_9BACT|nr:MAG: Uracil-DNA glycosylase-like protein [uncultured bacterium (gcode 4)]
MSKATFMEYSMNMAPNPDYRVYFIWLSHKLSKSWEILEAFCESTDSGKIISSIIWKCDSWSLIFRANLVRWVPLDDNHKLRYPSESEKLAWLRILEKEILEFRPKCIYLFGKQVSDFILKNLEMRKIDESEYIFWDTRFIFAQHPSYIAVYKRKHLPEYISRIINKINKIS